jgi:hypothetical protein
LDTGSSNNKLDNKVVEAIGKDSAASGSDIPYTFGPRPPNIAMDKVSWTADKCAFWMCSLASGKAQKPFECFLCFNAFCFPGAFPKQAKAAKSTRSKKATTTTTRKTWDISIIAPLLHCHPTQRCRKEYGRMYQGKPTILYVHGLVLATKTLIYGTRVDWSGVGD